MRKEHADKGTSLLEEFRIVMSFTLIGALLCNIFEWDPAVTGIFFCFSIFVIVLLRGIANIGVGGCLWILGSLLPLAGIIYFSTLV
jgi:hypothetical protein